MTTRFSATVYKLSCVLTLLMAGTGISAQNGEYYFHHFSIENGLSENYVNNVLQDTSGLIWIATGNGMNVYNGSKVTTFEDGPYSEFLSGFSGPCFIDSRNNLWVGPKGLYSFNITTGKWKHYLHDKRGGNSISYDMITKIKEDKEGNIWVGTRVGLNRIDIRTGRIQNYFYKGDTSRSETYMDNRIIDFEFDSNGFLWVITISGLKQFDLRKGKYTYKNIADLRNTSFHAIKYDGKGKLWLAANDTALLRLDIRTEKIKTYRSSSKSGSISSNSITDIFFDAKGTLWLGTIAGLNRLDFAKDSFIVYRNSFFNSDGLSDNDIRAIFEDRSGLLWIGTGSSGVDRLIPNKKKFEHIRYNPYLSNALSGKTVFDFVSVGKQVWVATSSGVNVFDPATKQIIPSVIQRQTASKNVNCLEEDKHGNIWMEINDSIFLYNKTSSKLAYIDHSVARFDNPKDNRVFHIKCISNGDIWAGTAKGIAIYNPKTKEWRNHANDSILKKFPHQYAIRLFEEADQTIWVSYSNGGILRCKSDGSIIKKIRPGNETGLPETDYIDITQDAKGNIWAAGSKGLCRIDSTYQIKVYTKGTGILSNRIKGVRVDKSGTLWITSDRGISAMNIETETINNYGVSDGLQSPLFSDHALLCSNNGECYFGGINGFNIYADRQIKTDTFIAPVILTGFTLLNVNIYNGNYSDTLRELFLRHNQNNFSFEFSALSFNHPELNNFAYKLEGYDVDWNYCGNRQFGSYTSLPPGNYLLKIIASNSDHIWNKKGRELIIHITSPFWKTKWFSALLIVFFLLVIFALYRSRVGRIKREESKKTEVNRKMAEVKMLALRAQMTPHFVFNSLSAIQHFIIESENDAALLFLSKFSRLLRSILNNASENKNTLEQEQEILKLYLELQSMRFSDTFRFKIEVENSEEISHIQLPSMLIQPFVENAIEHGILNKTGEGTITIKFYRKDGNIICEIEDDGIGREKAGEISKQKSNSYKSMGIKLSEQRIENMAEFYQSKATIDITDLYDSSNIGCGTIVRITFPIT